MIVDACSIFQVLFRANRDNSGPPHLNREDAKVAKLFFDFFLMEVSDLAPYQDTVPVPAFQSHLPKPFFHRPANFKDVLSVMDTILLDLEKE